MIAILVLNLLNFVNLDLPLFPGYLSENHFVYIFIYYNKLLQWLNLRINKLAWLTNINTYKATKQQT